MPATIDITNEITIVQGISGVLEEEPIPFQGWLATLRFYATG
ncbi:hypothetical protein DESC_290109 [Desulfosarcina cetonica]|nr:hypothetical protein DESC_290109 [Desulfosarcina cetonica]